MCVVRVANRGGRGQSLERETHEIEKTKKKKKKEKKFRTENGKRTGF